MPKKSLILSIFILIFIFFYKTITKSKFENGIFVQKMCKFWPPCFIFWFLQKLYFLILWFGSACLLARRKLVTTVLRSVWAFSFHALCMVQPICALPCNVWPSYFGAGFGALAYKNRFANPCVFHAGLRNTGRNQVR